MFISQIKHVTSLDPKIPQTHLNTIFQTWDSNKNAQGWNWSLPAPEHSTDGFFSWLKNTVMGAFGANKNWIYGPLFNSLKDVNKINENSIKEFIAIMLAPIVFGMILTLSSFLGFGGTFLSAWESRPSFLHITFWTIFIIFGLITFPITFSIIFFLAHIMSGVQSANTFYNLFFTPNIGTKLGLSLKQFFSYLLIINFFFLTLYSFGGISKTYGYLSLGFLLAMPLFILLTKLI
jgi:hypothetical protein